MTIRDKTRMTAAEFFQLPETNHIEELIDGELIVSPSPATDHQRLHRRLVKLLDSLITGGEIFYAPMDVYFDDDNTVQPDILWIAPNSKATAKDKYIDGAPDLIIEIHSPATRRKDRREKFDLYQKYGVREYWLVDPDGQDVEVYTHDGTRYVRVGVFGAEHTFESAVLEKTVALDGVFPKAEA